MLQDPWNRTQPPTTLKSMLDDYERRIIESALAATAGNQRRAAASLGLLPTTLHEKMKRLGLLRRQTSREPELAEVAEVVQ